MIPIAFVLAGFLLSVGWQVLLVLLVLAGSLALGTAHRLGGKELGMIAGNLTALGAIVILTSWLRNEIERRRLDEVNRLRAQTERANRELRGYQDRLEETVKRRTEQLEAAQAELVEAERLSVLGKISATVAHEIRNPLGTVRTSLHTIQEAAARNQESRLERAYALAERNVLRIEGIVRELLDYARRRDPLLVATPVDGWAEEILDEQAPPPGVACERRLWAGAAAAIDRELLGRALRNVLDNAFQALGEAASATKRLLVETTVVRTTGRVEIRVSDTGAGIPAGVRERVFEPLFSTKSFGFGLGMAIVKNVMEQHHGGVEIHSRTAEENTGPPGTTVVLWLPLTSPEGSG